MRHGLRIRQNLRNDFAPVCDSIYLAIAAAIACLNEAGLLQELDGGELEIEHAMKPSGTNDMLTNHITLALTAPMIGFRATIEGTVFTSLGLQWNAGVARLHVPDRDIKGQWAYRLHSDGKLNLRPVT